MRKLALVAIVLVTIASGCKSKPLPGVTYDFTTSISGSNQAREITGRAAVAGQFMSLEFDHGDGITSREHAIYLSRDGGDNYIVLQPDKKNYYKVSGDEAAGRMSKVLSMATEKLNLRIFNARSRVIEEGRGGKIHDYPTRKYNHTMSYDMTVSVGLQSVAASTVVKTRVWTTDMLSERYFDFLRKQQAKTGLAEIDDRIAADVKKIKGFPLRQVVETSVTANQVTQRSRAEMRIANIKQLDIPGERFEIPDGFEKVDPPAVDLSALLQMGQQLQ